MHLGYLLLGLVIAAALFMLGAGVQIVIVFIGQVVANASVTKLVLVLVVVVYLATCYRAWKRYTGKD